MSHPAEGPAFSSARTKLSVSVFLGITAATVAAVLGADPARRSATPWLSFPLGALIIATSINLVSGLAK